MDAPDVAWVTDITYVWTDEGWLYLAAILDLFSRRVVGHAMSERIDRALVLEALRDAVGRRVPDAGLLHHSDRGSQYASNDYQDALTERGMHLLDEPQGQLLGRGEYIRRVPRDGCLTLLGIDSLSSVFALIRRQPLPVVHGWIRRASVTS